MNLMTGDLPLSQPVQMLTTASGIGSWQLQTAGSHRPMPNQFEEWQVATVEYSPAGPRGLCVSRAIVQGAAISALRSE